MVRSASLPLRAVLLAAPACLMACLSIGDLNQRSVEHVKALASFDLKCPAEQIKTTNLTQGSDVYLDLGAEGCGQRARYKRVPGSMDADNAWMLNSDSRPAASSATP